MAKDESLLKEIRERFDHCASEWSSIREEAREDMKCVAGDPWPPEERKARKDANRPCWTFDELGQYVNQLINDAKQNDRAIKVTPVGNGANDKTAELQGNIIREIEYKSKAQSAYSNAFENAVQRSYGYWRIGAEYKSDKSFDQELRIKRVANPETIYIDPNSKERDGSDMEFAFVVESWSHDKFKRKYPKAEIKNFSAELQTEAPAWIKDTTVQVAEYWKIKRTKRTLIQMPDGSAMLLEPGQKPAPGMQAREVDAKSVCQYITNGVEILETNEWPGKYIPIVPVYGKEMYVDTGGGTKRILMSLIRLARNPYLAYCYTRTSEGELLGQVPKVPYVGYEGQFTDPNWALANKVPVAFLNVPVHVGDDQGQILPLPTKNNFEPAIQAMEMASESFRRSIQAAMGISALPTAAQRQNEKSGVALERIASQQSQGSYHFIDSLDGSLEQTGRILLDLVPHYYNTEGREIGVRKNDQTTQLIKLNKQYQDESTGEERYYPVDEGEHDATVSSGPSFNSQREEVSDFLEAFIGKVPPEIMVKVLDLIVKLKSLGPLGDEIADRLTPPEFAAKDGQEPLPPQAASQIAQLQQQLEMAQQAIQELTMEREAKKLDNDAKLAIAELNASIDRLKIQVDLQIAQMKIAADIRKQNQQLDHQEREMANAAE